MALKILFWDIEMAPAVVHSWGMFGQNHSISQVVEDPYMLSFSARWYGSKKKIFRSVHHDGHEAMVRALYELLDEADALVSWNGAGFDTKHANREFVKLGLPPYSPVKEIDLLKTARSKFRFLSNKLDYVAQYLGLGSKKSTGGHELWVACMAGDEKAWRTMRSYNNQDVDLLVDLYEYLLPWIANHPNMNLYGAVDACPRCGSESYQRRGLWHTAVSSYQRFRCNDCRHWFKSGRAVATAANR